MQITRIFCPVDQSDCSGKALRYAAALATAHGATLDVVTVIVNVIPPPVAELAMMPIVISEEVKADTLKALEEFTRTCGIPPAPVKIVEAATPVRGIIDYADATTPDLIVMGTHGWRGFDHLMFGSTTERVLHSTGCPVLTVPPSAKDVSSTDALRWDPVLCAYDFSPSAMSALEMGRALAEEQHGKVTLLHVLELLAPEDAHVVSHYQVSEYVAMRRQEARKQLQAVLPDPAGTWRDPCNRVELGAPAKTILRIAEDMRADLIAMGSQSHGAFRHLFLGSTTHTVVRRATCPVLVTRG